MQINRRTLLGGMMVAAVNPAVVAEAQSVGARVDVRKFGPTGPGVDALPTCRRALAELRRQGGGTLVMPDVGGYTLSDTLLIDFGPCHIELGDDVVLTKRSKASAFLFSGTFNRPIKDVSLIGVGAMRTVDGNGRNMVGYKYSTSDGYYSCVLFRWCDHWLLRNIYGYNGLVNCLRVFQCGPGENVDCAASHSVYDNGHTVDFDPPYRRYSDSDPATWSNGRITRPRAWQCAGLGVTCYGATGVVIADAQVRACGIDIASYPTNGGGLSVEGDISLAPQDVRNQRCVVLRPQINGCFNQGIHVSASGTTIVAPVVSDTLAPRKRANPYGLLGSSMVLVGKGAAVVRDAVLTNSGLHGVAMLGNDAHPSLDFAGTIHASRGHGIFARKFDRLVIQPGSVFSDNGSGPNDAGVMAIGAEMGNGLIPFAPKQGTVLLSGQITGSAGPAADIQQVAEVRIDGVQLTGNRRASQASGAVLKLDNNDAVLVHNVHNVDPNRRTSYILAVTRSGASPVLGDIGGDAALGAIAP